MTKLIFIEGISGVGKSTTARAVAEALRSRGAAVRLYLEGDGRNPLDFYAAAYLAADEFSALCERFPGDAATLRTNATAAGDAFLVRYRDGDAELFAEPLCAELAAHEFSYKPPRPIPLERFTDAYGHVRRGFARSLECDPTDYCVFDGSLLHHPLGDLIRNYDASPEQAVLHIKVLLNALSGVNFEVFYLFSSDPASRLHAARAARGQSPASRETLDFWLRRAELDAFVLRRCLPHAARLDISDGWQAAFDQALKTILYNERSPTMNETMNTLLTRRSCRSFTGEHVSRELIDQIVAAGLKAPSGMNKQTPRFIVVTNDEARTKLANLNVPPMFAGRDPFYGAKDVIVVVAKKEGTYVYDGSLAIGNMLNAAWSLGVGACWIHRAKDAFDCDEGKALLAEWGITEEVEGIGCCILGNTKEEKALMEVVDGRVFYVD